MRCMLRVALSRSTTPGLLATPWRGVVDVPRGVLVSSSAPLPVPSTLCPGRARWSWVRAACYALGGVCAGALAGGGAAALCRPLDTPPYLIPYYVRDVRSRFAHYASVRKRKGGPAYMTVDDFVLALLASPNKELKNPSVTADLRDLFNTLDANGDGYISFPEFRFLMALLTTHPKDIQTLFRVVDEAGHGGITLEQFSRVLRGVTGDEGLARGVLKPSSRRNGLLCTLFGPDEAHAQRCSFESLHRVIHDIRTEVWKAEFRQYDVEHKGHITAEEFSELIASQVLGSHLPYYLVNNIRKLRGGEGGSVTLEMWTSFHEVMQHGEDLVTAVEVYCSSGLPLTQNRFERALQAAGVPDMPRTTIELIFAIFDRNNDGTMEFDEFISIMRQKINYHYSAPVRDRKSLPRRFVECSKAALESLEQ